LSVSLKHSDHLISLLKDGIRERSFGKLAGTLISQGDVPKTKTEDLAELFPNRRNGMDSPDC
jgi:hypothetical protein